MSNYEYVRIEVQPTLLYEDLDHRKMIKQYAAQGYRCVGIVPAAVRNENFIFLFDLIMEPGQWNQQYEFVKCKINGVFDFHKYDCREKIDSYVEQGYRYIGYLPCKQAMIGSYIDLIFERDAE